MDRLNQFSSDSQHIVAEAKKVKKMEGRIVKRFGHTTYEYNYVTKKMGLATKKETNAILVNGKSVIQHKMVANENCTYFQSLNETNAWKKVWQMGLINDQEYLSNVMRIKTRKK